MEPGRRCLYRIVLKLQLIEEPVSQLIELRVAALGERRSNQNENERDVQHLHDVDYSDAPAAWQFQSILLEHRGHALRIFRWRTQMYCTQCGVELRADDRFCSRCGRNTGVGGVETVSRPLLLDKHNKKIGGVGAGFARYFEADVILVRVLWLRHCFNHRSRLPGLPGGLDRHAERLWPRAACDIDVKSA